MQLSTAHVSTPLINSTV